MKPRKDNVITNATAIARKLNINRRIGIFLTSLRKGAGFDLGEVENLTGCYALDLQRYELGWASPRAKDIHPVICLYGSNAVYQTSLFIAALRAEVQEYKKNLTANPELQYPRNNFEALGSVKAFSIAA